MCDINAARTGKTSAISSADGLNGGFAIREKSTADFFAPTRQSDFCLESSGRERKEAERVPTCLSLSFLPSFEIYTSTK